MYLCKLSSGVNYTLKMKNGAVLIVLFGINTSAGTKAQ